MAAEAWGKANLERSFKTAEVAHRQRWSSVRKTHRPKCCRERSIPCSPGSQPLGMTRLCDLLVSLNLSARRLARRLIYLCCFLFLVAPAAEWSEKNGECQAGGVERWMTGCVCWPWRAPRESVCLCTASPWRGGCSACIGRLSKRSLQQMSA